MFFIKRKCWILTFKVGYTFLQDTLYKPCYWDLVIWCITILDLQVHHRYLKHLSLFETFKYGITIWNTFYYLNITSLIWTSFSTFERYSSLSWQYKFPCLSSVLMLLKFYLNPGQTAGRWSLNFSLFKNTKSFLPTKEYFSLKSEVIVSRISSSTLPVNIDTNPFH